MNQDDEIDPYLDDNLSGDGILDFGDEQSAHNGGGNHCGQKASSSRGQTSTPTNQQIGGQRGYEG